MQRSSRRWGALTAAALLGGAIGASCTGEDFQAAPTSPADDAGPDQAAAATPEGGRGDAELDAAAAGDADASAAPFSPSDLGGRLVLWYEGSPKNLMLSDAGDGTILGWKDRSTFGLDAVIPTADTHVCGGVTSLPDDAGGARNVVDFTTYCQRIGDEHGQPNLDFGTREYLVEVVTSLNPGAATPTISLFDRVDAFGRLGALRMQINVGHVKVELKPNDADAAATQTLTSANATMDDHALHVVAMRRIKQAALPKDTISLRIDGVHEELQGDPVNLDLGGTFFFGGNYRGFGPVYGYDLRIAEMIVVASPTALPVSDADVAAIEGYLKAKYKTP